MEWKLEMRHFSSPPQFKQHLHPLVGIGVVKFWAGLAANSDFQSTFTATFFHN